MTLEAQWRGSKAFVSGSYSHNHYWGNFDQDNYNDRQRRQHLHRLVNIGDGAGRQLWNFQ